MTRQPSPLDSLDSLAKLTACLATRYAAFACLALVFSFAAVVLVAPASAAADDARIELLQAKPRAYAIVENAGRSDAARIRLAAIEASQYAPDAAVDLARMGLTDNNPAVRFAALVSVGKLKLTTLAQAAVDLTLDENPSVRAAAIFAARRCGIDIDPSPLAQMLGSADASTRANAALLVGQLGDPQAIPMLAEMASLPMPRALPAQRTWVRLQFAEAIARLDPNDEKVLGTIRASMFSNLQDVRILAIQILGDVGDQTVLGSLGHIVKRDNPIQVQIAAAHALLQMGDDQALDTLLDATRYDTQTLQKDIASFLRKLAPTSPEAQAARTLMNSPDDRLRAAAEVRAQAARALAFQPTETVVARLVELMDDPAPIVQVAAASAILRAAR